MMDRYLFSALAVMVLAMVTGFFYYVPLLPLMAAALVVIGLGVVFACGVYVGHDVGRESKDLPAAPKAAQANRNTEFLKA